MLTLKGKLVRLAYSHKELRPEILPLLTKGAGRQVVHSESQKRLKKLWGELKDGLNVASRAKDDLQSAYLELQSAYIDAGDAAKEADPGNPYAHHDFYDTREGEKMGAEVNYVQEAQQLADEVYRALKSFERAFSDAGAT